MQPFVTTSSALVLARNLPSKSSRPSLELRWHRRVTQLHSAIFDAQSRAAFHFRSISGSVRMHWLCSQCFTADEIRLSGGAGYNYSLVRTPIGAAQFRRYVHTPRRVSRVSARRTCLETPVPIWFQANGVV
jgi:hypothetical protein